MIVGKRFARIVEGDHRFPESRSASGTFVE